MNLKPHGDRLLLEFVQKEVIDVKNKENKLIIDAPNYAGEDDLAKKIAEKTGAALPTGGEDDYPRWKVLAVGETVQYYKVDDVVLCHGHAGTDFAIKKGGKDVLLRILPEREVYGNII